MPYITVTKKDILLGSQRDWGHENERGRIIEVEKGKKGTILEVKKGRTLVRTSQPVKILPVCSNGTETVVGISNRQLIMEVLEIVYLRSSRFCINAHAFILLRSLIFFKNRQTKQSQEKRKTLNIYKSKVKGKSYIKWNTFTEVSNNEFHTQVIKQSPYLLSGMESGLSASLVSQPKNTTLS